MDRVERRLDATLKIVQTGMKMLVAIQKEHREFTQEMRGFKNETRYAINALVEAQMRTDAVVSEMGRKLTEVGNKLDRLTDALLKPPRNGGSR